MTKEQRDAAMKMLTEYERVSAENLAMKALLDGLQKNGAFKNFAYQGQNSTWQEELDYLMKGAAREKIHESVLPILRQIEQAFQDAELSQLLAAFPPKGPVN
jgi:hypothetical protein